MSTQDFFRGYTVKSANKFVVGKIALNWVLRLELTTAEPSANPEFFHNYYLN
jgi:hypothetical protein